jgi:hypothetical protein
MAADLYEMNQAEPSAFVLHSPIAGHFQFNADGRYVLSRSSVAGLRKCEAFLQAVSSAAKDRKICCASVKRLEMILPA